MNPVLIIIILISASLGALLAKSRNRTPWKGALGGALPITLLAMIIFLKTKGERTKKNRMIDRVIVGSIVLIIIGGFITRTIVEDKLKDSEDVIAEVGAKLNYLDKLNEDVPPTISFSGYYDTLFLTLSLESEAKETQEPYSVIERQFKDGGTLNCTKVYYNWYSKESPVFLENAKNIGYKNFQAKVLYKDGTIEESTIIALD